MTEQNEHLMELATEIVRLRTENEKLKQELNMSVPYEVVRGLKTDLYNALDEARIVREQFDSLLESHRQLSQTLANVRQALST
jgi:hypothetical protein